MVSMKTKLNLWENLMKSGHYKHSWSQVRME